MFLSQAGLFYAGWISSYLGYFCVLTDSRIFQCDECKHTFKRFLLFWGSQSNTTWWPDAFFVVFGQFLVNGMCLAGLSVEGGGMLWSRQPPPTKHNTPLTHTQHPNPSPKDTKNKSSLDLGENCYRNFPPAFQDFSSSGWFVCAFWLFSLFIQL